MEESTLHSMWQFSAVCQFLHTFYSCFKPQGTTYVSSNPDEESSSIDEFETEILETTLLGGPPIEWLRDLHIRLLRFLTRNRFVTEETWLMYFSKEFEKRAYLGDELLFVYEEGLQYYDLDVKTRLEKPDQIRLINDTPESVAVEWRVDPIGYDAKGNAYWLFDDNRLYMEHSPEQEQQQTKKSKSKKKSGNPSRKRKKSSTTSTPAEPESSVEEEAGPEEDEAPTSLEPEAPRPTWELVCSTIQDWQTFPQRFEGSRNASEKFFYNYLQNHVLDPVLSALREKEKEAELRERILHRKRSTRILSRETRSLGLRGVDGQLFEESTVTDHHGHRRSGRQAQVRSQMESVDRESSDDKLDSREKRRLEREMRVQQQIELERLKFEREQIEALLASQADADQQMQLEENESPVDISDCTKTKRTEEYEDVVPAAKKKKSSNEWLFDCSCGIKKKNYDDGNPSISCEKCNRWKHISCVVKDLQLDPALSEDPVAWEKRDFLCLKCVEKKEVKERKKSAASAVGSPNLNGMPGTPGPGTRVPSNQSPLLSSPSKIKITLGPVPQVVVPNAEVTAQSSPLVPSAILNQTSSTAVQLPPSAQRLSASPSSNNQPLVMTSSSSAPFTTQQFPVGMIPAIITTPVVPVLARPLKSGSPPAVTLTLLNSPPIAMGPGSLSSRPHLLASPKQVSANQEVAPTLSPLRIPGTIAHTPPVSHAKPDAYSPRISSPLAKTAPLLPSMSQISPTEGLPPPLPAPIISHASTNGTFRDVLVKQEENAPKGLDTLLEAVTMTHPSVDGKGTSPNGLLVINDAKKGNAGSPQGSSNRDMEAVAYLSHFASASSQPQGSSHS